MDMTIKSIPPKKEFIAFASFKSCSLISSFLSHQKDTFRSRRVRMACVMPKAEVRILALLVEKTASYLGPSLLYESLRISLGSARLRSATVEQAVNW